MLWKDSNNKVHDDMDGQALSLPVWPQGMTQITQTEADILLAAYAPPTPIPSLTPRQIRLVLNASGLRTQVEAAVAASNQDTKDMWEFSQEYIRDDPILLGMATALGMSSVELDQLFIAGSKL